MTQHRRFQVKTMFFEIAKHLFSPHPASVIAQGHLPIRQIGGQAPRTKYVRGFFLTDLPMNQQVGGVDLLGGQIASSQPDTLTGLVDVTTEGLPARVVIKPDQAIGFLAQDIPPTPLIQLPQDRHCPKFAVSDQENGGSFGNQLANIGQQSQLLIGAAVPFDVFDPGPDDGEGPFPVRQAHDQQLMPKADLSAIHNQTDLSQISKLPFQPLPGDGFVPFPYPDGGISQQPAQAAGHAQQLSRARNLSGNPAQTHRSALKDPNDQPDEVTGLGDPLTRSQELNPLKPGMIERVGRHEVPPVKKFDGKNYFNRIVSADQLFCC